MLTRSTAFDVAIIAGAPVVTQAQVVRAGAVVGILNLLPGAKIKLDDTAASRRSFIGQVANTGIAPHLPTDLLAPFGIELIVKTGLVLPNGSTEMIPLGVFRPNVVADDTTGLITISGPDRAVVVAQALNEAPYSIAAGTPLDAAIGSYLAAKYPSLPFYPDPVAHTLTLASTAVYQTGTASGDPWANCRDLAATFGRELFVDATGNAILRPIPDPNATPVVWSFEPGQANLALSGTHSMDTSANVHNVVVVSGSGTGVTTPITVTAEITNVGSPIYPSPTGFGRRPLFFSSSQITNATSAAVVAQALLAQQIGLFDQVMFTAIPHPCLEPSDVVSYASDLLGFQTHLVLASWELQVDLLAPMQVSTRTAGSLVETVLQDVLNASVS